MSNFHIEPRLHRGIERTLGTGDLRMLYGLGAPMIVVCAIVIAACVTDQMWLAALAMVAIFALVPGILHELGRMLDETGDEDLQRS